MFRKLSMLATAAGAAKPIVDLSLGSTHGFGQVEAAISASEKASAGNFAADMAQLEQAYSSTLSKASVTLGSTISKALAGRSSFANIVEPVIAVRVIDAPSDEMSGVAGMKALDSKMAGAESALVSAARAEMEELAKIVIGEYEKQIRASRRSFLRFSREINVRLSADANMPSVSGLLSSHVSRRDTQESALRGKILSLESSLVQALNKIAAAALGPH